MVTQSADRRPQEDAAAHRAFLTRSAAIASMTVAALLLALKIYAAVRTGSTAMLGSLADTALDIVASLVTLIGVVWSVLNKRRAEA